ncbi:hypothetical protein D3C87_637090 [compost metagenome]
MSDIRILFPSPGTGNLISLCLGFFSEEAHAHLREWCSSQGLDAAFTYDTSSALYSGVVYVHDVTEQQHMLLKLMT